MRKTRFSEFQIVKILKAAEGCRAVTDICREHGVSSATYDKRMKELEAEHATLKQLFAELRLENMVLKDVIENTL